MIDVIAVISTVQYFGDMLFTAVLLVQGIIFFVAPVLILAFALGLLFRTTPPLFKIGLVILCLLPAAVFPILRQQIREESVAARWTFAFKSELSDPIPKSVKRVAVESSSADLLDGYLQRFTIAKADLDPILCQKASLA